MPGRGKTGYYKDKWIHIRQTKKPAPKRDGTVLPAVPPFFPDEPGHSKTLSVSVNDNGGPARPSLLNPNNIGVFSWQLRRDFRRGPSVRLHHTGLAELGVLAYSSPSLPMYCSVACTH